MNVTKYPVLSMTISLMILFSYIGCSYHQRSASAIRPIESDKCKSGWFKAKNVNTKLKLSCFHNNEEFEIFCPQESLKANGVCLVKWYADGEQIGELITEYVDGLQKYEAITLVKVKSEFPYYSETLTQSEWDKFSHEIKTSIYFEAAREKRNFNHGGRRYQYPETLVQGQSILDTVRYLENYKKRK